MLHERSLLFYLANHTYMSAQAITQKKKKQQAGLQCRSTQPSNVALHCPYSAVRVEAAFVRIWPLREVRCCLRQLPPTAPAQLPITHPYPKRNAGVEFGTIGSNQKIDEPPHFRRLRIPPNIGPKEICTRLIVMGTPPSALRFEPKLFSDQQRCLGTVR